MKLQDGQLRLSAPDLMRFPRPNSGANINHLGSE